MDDTAATPEYAAQPTASPAPPVPPSPAAPPPPPVETGGPHRGGRNVGIILILLGLFFYAQQFLPALSWAVFWPGILIVIGILVLLKARRS